MNHKLIENAIIKYLVGEADRNDLDVLFEWIQDPKNQMLFEHYVEVHYKVNLIMSEPNIDEIKKHLITQIRSDNRKIRQVKRRKSILKYAAVVVLCLSLGGVYMFKKNQIKQIPEVHISEDLKTTIQQGTDKAILTLNNGEHIPLAKGETFESVNVVSNGEEIVYQGKAGNKEIVYNVLTIPRGGKFFIKLADGTEVWLNSDTQLKYPTGFIDGKLREVELVYGEAYFHVSPSTNHKGSSFTVLNKSQKIEVLGTVFNIKAYNDETHIYTTLVEGKVAVNYEGVLKPLKPNEQSNVDLDNKSISVKVVDIEEVVSWRMGVFTFNKKPLKDIMKVISRWYDVDVVFEDKSLETLNFTGVLSKNQNLEEILKTINNLSIIKKYEIYDKKIVLK
ncbi:FecR domain-containing protein [Mariniflexile litorale]|uniref:FecR domain-containing protein n=1 Tax=Mariniflexile litorale TaxID=3045158 RepID=A0AAU7EDK1_9FLAO|nr:FecR domain-containing protein [Mariniflexile sp. KMM 9835]MDQ8212888.1 DUF4974 domain-containing protein [Mariniflexile sp. KMM 9835]